MPPLFITQCIEKHAHNNHIKTNLLLHQFFSSKYFADYKKCHTFASAIDKIARVLSSVGSEHLVYTQRVGGSNPSGPTLKRKSITTSFFILISIAPEYPSAPALSISPDYQPLRNFSNADV